MRKNVFGKQLKRDTNERKALIKNLASSLVLEDKIETTIIKAKVVRPYVEKLITKARKSAEPKKAVQPFLNKKATEKMISDTALRFNNRNGGYTRIIHIGNRKADNAEMATIEFTEMRKEVKSVQKDTKTKKVVKKSAKATKDKEVKKNIKK